jgi:hypothetical protein
MTDFLIENYTLDELLEIIGLDPSDEYSEKDITNAVLYMKSQILDASLNTFLGQIQTKLLASFDEEQQIYLEPEGLVEHKLYVNPAIKNNLINRLILVDSQYRDHTQSSTMFSVALKEPILKALSLRLYSYSIPYTFYNINNDNNYFWIDLDSSSSSTLIAVTPGKYTPETLQQAIQTLLQDLSGGSVTYSATTGKMTFTNISTILFSQTTTLPRSSLGHMLGFRTVSISDSATSEAVVDLIYPKYFVLDIDDYTQIHLTAGLAAAITRAPETTLPLPAYYTCQNSIISFPRTLTRAQIYSISQIKQNQQKQVISETPLKSKSTFAVIPFKHNESISNINTEFGGSLQDNKRIYIGPTTLTQLKITLYDDRGKIVDMNGCDWNFVLLSESEI